MKKYKIKFNNKIYEVEVEELPLDCKTNKKDIIKSEIKKEDNASLGNAVVKAPMPGKIIDIKIKEGQEVEKGQVLVILEAMKLENEIISPIDGRVSCINIEKGSLVELDTALIKLE